MEEIEYTMLQWVKMPDHGGIQPETTLCLFSDGYADHRIGFWSRSDQCLRVPNNNGTNMPISHSRFRYWAKLGNFQNFSNVREPIKGIES